MKRLIQLSQTNQLLADYINLMVLLVENPATLAMIKNNGSESNDDYLSVLLKIVLALTNQNTKLTSELYYDNIDVNSPEFH